MVVLPTPPLPLATARKCFTFSMPFNGALGNNRADSSLLRATTFTRTEETSGNAPTTFLISPMSIFFKGEVSLFRARVRLTIPSCIETLRIKPRSTRLFLNFGCRTGRKDSTMCCSSITFTPFFSREGGHGNSRLS